MWNINTEFLKAVSELQYETQQKDVIIQNAEEFAWKSMKVLKDEEV